MSRSREGMRQRCEGYERTRVISRFTACFRGAGVVKTITLWLAKGRSHLERCASNSRDVHLLVPILTYFLLLFSLLSLRSVSTFFFFSFIVLRRVFLTFLFSVTSYHATIMWPRVAGSGGEQSFGKQSKKQSVAFFPPSSFFLVGFPFVTSTTP